MNRSTAVPLRDTITFGKAVSKGFVDLGDGVDTLNLAAGSNTVTVANIESVFGNTGTDAVTLSAELTAASSIDLGTGKDSLTLGNFDNVGSVSNVETLTGGSGSDTITYATIVTGGSINLGAGDDTLILGDFANTATVSGVESPGRRHVQRHHHVRRFGHERHR